MFLLKNLKKKERINKIVDNKRDLIITLKTREDEAVKDVGTVSLRSEKQGTKYIFHPCLGTEEQIVLMLANPTGRDHIFLQ